MLSPCFSAPYFKSNRTSLVTTHTCFIYGQWYLFSMNSLLALSFKLKGNIQRSPDKPLDETEYEKILKIKMSQNASFAF